MDPGADIEVRGHREIGPALEDHLLNPALRPLDEAGDARAQRRSPGERTEDRPQFPPHVVAEAADLFRRPDALSRFGAAVTARSRWT